MTEDGADGRGADAGVGAGAGAGVRAFPVFDPAKPSGARVWNYWSGGKDYFDADREVAEQVLDVMPAVALVARLTRQFLIRVVHVLAADYGIRQFLDIGCGMPMPVNTHQAAAEAAPDSRAVYTDIDPLAISHFRELLAGEPAGRHDCFQSDVRDPAEILSRAGQTLDLRSPVALLLVTVLQNVPDADDPYAAVARLMAGLAPGSFLVIVHPPSDRLVPIGTEISRRYNSAPLPPVTMRSYADMTRFFGGLELIGPGLVNGPFWLTPDEIAAAAAGVSTLDVPEGMDFGYLGVARKPLRASFPHRKPSLGGVSRGWRGVQGLAGCPGGRVSPQWHLWVDSLPPKGAIGWKPSEGDATVMRLMFASGAPNGLRSRQTAPGRCVSLTPVASLVGQMTRFTPELRAPRRRPSIWAALARRVYLLGNFWPQIACKSYPIK
jgi:hypothetical protein